MITVQEREAQQYSGYTQPPPKHCCLHLRAKCFLYWEMLQDSTLNSKANWAQKLHFSVSAPKRKVKFWGFQWQKTLPSLLKGEGSFLTWGWLYCWRRRVFWLNVLRQCPQDKWDESSWKTYSSLVLSFCRTAHLFVKGDKTLKMEVEGLMLLFLAMPLSVLKSLCG